MAPNRYERINMLLDNDRLDDAEQLLSDGLRDNPQSAVLLILSARLEILRRNYDLAATAARAALAVAPTSVSGLNMLAIALSRSGLHQDARNAADRAVAAAPHKSSAYFTRSTICLAEAYARRIKDKERRYRIVAAQALADADRAVELSPSSSEYHRIRAEALLECKQPQEARSACLTALELNPNNALAFAVLARIANRAGLHDQAFDYASAGLLNNPHSKALQRELRESATNSLLPAFTAVSLPAAVLSVSRWFIGRPPGSTLAVVTAVGTVAALAFFLYRWRSLPAMQRAAMTNGGGRFLMFLSAIPLLAIPAISALHFRTDDESEATDLGVLALSATLMFGVVTIVFQVNRVIDARRRPDSEPTATEQVDSATVATDATDR